MRLYDKPDRPFKFYDFTLRGQRYRGSTGERTEKAAMKVATTYRDQLAAGDPATRRSSKVPTLREFSKTYLEYVQQSGDLEANSRKYYAYGIRLLEFSALADVPIDEIDKKMVATTKFQRPVINRKTGERTGEWVECSKTYSQQALRTLRVMLGHAVEWRTLDVKPKITIGKTPGRDGQITPGIEAVILRELSGYRTKRPWLVVMTAQDTGCRPEEIFEMRLENIDWAGRRILIASGKSENARRFVGMTERMHRELSAWCHGSNEPGWLFPSRTSGSKNGHLNSINKSFKAACTRGGLDPSLVLYLARHTYGTTAMEASGNTFQVSKAMGHGSVASMAPYQHPSTKPLTDVMNRRNDLVEHAKASLAS
jgi:integrase